MDQPPHPKENPTQQSPSLAPLHRSDAEEDYDTIKQLQECSSLYLSLQDCLIKTNRNWKCCQMEVQALKDCNEKRNSKVRRS